MPQTPPKRGDVRQVSAAIFLTIAFGAFAAFGHHLATTPNGFAAYAVNVLGLAIGFLVPAQWIARPGDVLRHWRIVVLAVCVGTLIWDALLARVAPRHIFFDGGLLIYAASLVFFGLLLSLHGIVVALLDGIRRARGRRIG